MNVVVSKRRLNPEFLFVLGMYAELQVKIEADGKVKGVEYETVSYRH
jgi:hypothetical protein